VQKPRVFITRKLALDPRTVLGPGIDIDQHDSELAVSREALLQRSHDVQAAAHSR
jgi:hypothetical protein